MFKRILIKIKLNISIKYLLFSSLVFIGCSYQITKVFEGYLDFQTKIGVSFDSKSQIVIPMISFCKNLDLSYRNLFQQTNELSAADINNKTFNFDEIFMWIEFRNKENQWEKFNYTEFERSGFQTIKTISFDYVCYHIKHPQINPTKSRAQGIIYEFWMYHHHRNIFIPYFYDDGNGLSEFKLYLSSNNNYPNGESFNSLNLIGKSSKIIYFCDIIKDEVLYDFFLFVSLSVHHFQFKCVNY